MINIINNRVHPRAPVSDETAPKLPDSDHYWKLKIWIQLYSGSQTHVRSISLRFLLRKLELVSGYEVAQKIAYNGT